MFTIHPDTTMDAMAYTADAKIRNAQAELTKFQERIGENPLHAFQWGAGAVEAAARIEVWSSVKRWSSVNDATGRGPDWKPTPTARLLEAMLSQAVKGLLPPSSAGSRSTSVMSNLCEDCVRSEWKDVVARLTGEWL